MKKKSKLEEIYDAEEMYGVSAQSSLLDAYFLDTIRKSHADIRELGLSEKPLNVLCREGISTVSELAALRVQRLYGMRGLSKPGFREITERLRKYGERLADRPRR